jgi:predicted MFS family arabinose efflux permease
VTIASANPTTLEIEDRPTDRPETRLATRLAFLVAGFGLAAWAPLVPYARGRVGVDDGMLGLLLLSLGVGSLVAMPMTGILSARFGSKPIIVSGALGMVVFLPLLTVAATPISLGLVLFVSISVEN